MIDNGFPLTTEPNILREMIAPPNIVSKVLSVVTGNTTTMGNMTNKVLVFHGEKQTLSIPPMKFILILWKKWTPLLTGQKDHIELETSKLQIHCISERGIFSSDSREYQRHETNVHHVVDPIPDVNLKSSE
ncbi:hypothetical protein OROMI_019779 [Orobanche minor]